MREAHYEFVYGYINLADTDDKVLEAIKVLALMEIADNTEYIS